MRPLYKYFVLLVTVFAMHLQAAFAQAATSSSMNNPLVVTFVVIMLLLLLVIGILANILINVAKGNSTKNKKENKLPGAASLTIFLLLLSQTVFAQSDATTIATPIVANTIGGMDSFAFYVVISVLAAELIVILAMLFNIKTLMVTEEQQQAKTEAQLVKAAKKATASNWWDRINKLRPISQEAALDLGHEYDGIRELNNRLPPWWLYGFYISILFAVIYLWRFHVSHDGLTGAQEYETAVAKANIDIQEYLKTKGEAVDENTVTLLTDANDIAAGKAIFTDPSKCVACHGAEGGGNAVGPNLTDNYWLNGGGVKDIFKTIKYGTSKGMRSWKDDLSAKQIAQLTSFIKSINGTKPANPKEPQGELYKEAASADTNTVKK
jgi:cytochrome c oxidase cbb3-type subunit III